MQHSTRPKRPFTVTLVLLGVILFGSINVWRIFALTQQSSLLLTLDVRPDPRIRLVLAGVWAIIFWGAALALWQQRPWSRQTVPLLLATYAFYDIFLQAVFVRVPGVGSTVVLRVLLWTGVVVFAAWALNRTAVKPYFSEERMEKQD